MTAKSLSMEDLCLIYQEEFKKQYLKKKEVMWVSSLQKFCFCKISYLIRREATRRSTWKQIGDILPDSIVRKLYADCFSKILMILFRGKKDQETVNEIQEGRLWKRIDSSFASIALANKIKNFVLDNKNKFSHFT